MTHTPGPYKVEKTLSGVPGFEIVTALNPKRGHRYCRGLAKVYEGDLIPNGRANADLFAESPNLLDALVRAEQMIRILVLRGVFSGDCVETAENEAANFRAIVMKAKGLSPKKD